MSGCCDPTPYDTLFDGKEAARNARSYRRRGLDSMAESMVEYLISAGIDGATVLEVGGGVGAIQLELLGAGAASSVNVEISRGYEEAATQLIAARDLEDRITRRIGDFVQDQDEFQPADILVMNRVVCCYPHMAAMMLAATVRADRYLALTFPREKWWVRFGFELTNLLIGSRGSEFRAYVHPVEDIEMAARNAGFVIRHADHNWIWQALVMERN